MGFKSGFGVVSVCGLVSRNTDTKPSRDLPSSQTPGICNLTRESSRVSLLSNNMYTRTLYTPPILHKLHTRPEITWFSSHMSRAGTLTDWTSSRDVSRTVRTHTQTRTSKVSTLYTTHSSNFPKQMVWYQLRLSFKSGLGVVSVCGHVSTHTHTKPSKIESQTTLI